MHSNNNSQASKSSANTHTSAIGTNQTLDEYQWPVKATQENLSNLFRNQELQQHIKRIPKENWGDIYSSLHEKIDYRTHKEYNHAGGFKRLVWSQYEEIVKKENRHVYGIFNKKVWDEEKNKYVQKEYHRKEPYEWNINHEDYKQDDSQDDAGMDGSPTVQSQVKLNYEREKKQEDDIFLIDEFFEGLNLDTVELQVLDAYRKIIKDEGYIPNQSEVASATGIKQSTVSKKIKSIRHKSPNKSKNHKIFQNLGKSTSKDNTRKRDDRQIKREREKAQFKPKECATVPQEPGNHNSTSESPS